MLAYSIQNHTICHEKCVHVYVFLKYFIVNVYRNVFLYDLPAPDHEWFHLSVGPWWCVVDEVSRASPRAVTHHVIWSPSAIFHFVISKTLRNSSRRNHSKMFAFFRGILDWIKSLFWKEEMELTLVGLQYSGKTTFVNVIAVGT